MPPRKQNLPKYVTAEKDSRGRLYIYFRRRGQPKVRMPDKPWSPAFMEHYHKLLGGEAVVHPVPQTGDTLRWLVDRYLASSEFRRLNLRTQRVRRQILEACLDEPINEARPTGDKYAELPLKHVTGKAIRVLRERKADAPEAANARVKALRQVFAWEVEEEHCDRNPARDIPYIKTGSQGFHSWTLEEVEQYEARHPVGTRARLALALLLYTGQRRSDVGASADGISATAG